MWIIIQQEKHRDRLIGESFGPFPDYETASKEARSMDKTHTDYNHFIKELIPRANENTLGDGASDCLDRVCSSNYTCKRHKV